MSDVLCVYNSLHSRKWNESNHIKDDVIGAEIIIPFIVVHINNLPGYWFGTSSLTWKSKHLNLISVLDILVLIFNKYLFVQIKDEPAVLLLTNSSTLFRNHLRLSIDRWSLNTQVVYYFYLRYSRRNTRLSREILIVLRETPAPCDLSWLQVWLSGLGNVHKSSSHTHRINGPYELIRKT